MFDFPLPISRAAIYEKLEVGPEATAEEIGDARTELVNSLRARRMATDRALEEVYALVPEFKSTAEELKTLEGQGREADPARLRRVQIRLGKLEEEAVRINPQFVKLRGEAAELDSEVHAANLIALQSAEERLKYDRANPPCELLKLVDCRHDEFRENRVAMTLVRRELTEFLSLSGEDVFSPSDLTREDFSHDFNHTPLLDGNDE